LPPEEDAVLAVLFSAIHQNFTGLVSIKDLTREVNSTLKRSGERSQLNPRRAGAIVKNFGVNHRQRTNSGWVILLDREDQERIHKLANNHGMDHRGAGYDFSDCPYCGYTKQSQLSRQSIERAKKSEISQELEICKI
jgi:hypothetical protein